MNLHWIWPCFLYTTHPHPSFCFPFWSPPAHGSLTDQVEPCSLIPKGLSKFFCFCQGDHPFLYFLFLKRKKVSYSVISDSLQHHGLYSPWNSLGQNTGVGSLSLFQGIFPTQGSFFFFFLSFFCTFFEYLSNSVLSFRHHQGQGLMEAFTDTQRHLSDSLD